MVGCRHRGDRPTLLCSTLVLGLGLMLKVVTRTTPGMVLTLNDAPAPIQRDAQHIRQLEARPQRPTQPGLTESGRTGKNQTLSGLRPDAAACPLTVVFPVRSRCCRSCSTNWT